MLAPLPFPVLVSTFLILTHLEAFAYLSSYRKVHLHLRFCPTKTMDVFAKDLYSKLLISHFFGVLNNSKSSIFKTQSLKVPEQSNEKPLQSLKND